MNPQVKCWLCGKRLEITTDGNGNTVARCHPCLEAIARLKIAARRPPGLCEWCGEAPERHRGLCDRCHKEKRMASQRECQARFRAKRAGLSVARPCEECGEPLSRYRRRWCPECAEIADARSNRRAYLRRREATQKRRIA